VEGAKQELREYTEELKASLDSGAAKYMGNTSQSACPAWASGGVGSVTIGVLYLRSGTVNNAIAKMLPGDDKPGPFTRFLGSIVRSRIGAGSASYDGINDKVIEEATPLIVNGIAGAHITIVPGKTEKMKPGCGNQKLCPDKKGMVLMEFEVCGASPEQKPLFKCCSVWGSTATSKLGRMGQAIGNWAFDKFTGYETGKSLIGGKMIDGLTNELPGQLMSGLEQANITNPNVIVWPEAINAGAMFQGLATAPQTPVGQPQPDCPPTGPSGPCHA
jgi:hypothetical protein